MLDPSHLLEQARREINWQTAGAPRQSDLCRAISTAYYALFHGLMSEVATMFATDNQPVTRSLFYRGLEHKKTRERCVHLAAQPLSALNQNFFHRIAFAPELQEFANVFDALQQERHRADYDPGFKITRADALAWVNQAEDALRNLRRAENNEKSEFLAYLLFGRR